MKKQQSLLPADALPLCESCGEPIDILECDGAGACDGNVFCQCGAEVHSLTGRIHQPGDCCEQTLSMERMLPTGMFPWWNGERAICSEEEIVNPPTRTEERA